MPLVNDMAMFSERVLSRLRPGLSSPVQHRLLLACAISAWRRGAQRCSTLAPSFSQHNRRFGRDYARRMAFRQAVLNVTLEVLRRVSACYLQAD